MKLRKIILIIPFLTIIVLNTATSVFSMNTGFYTEELSEKDYDVFMSNMDVALFTEELPKNSIACFDVNDNGLIAIGTKTINGTYVSIYDSDGIFQYGYTFSCSGTYEIEWDEDNLIIYYVRSDVAASIDKNGNCVELRKIPYTENNNSYLIHVLHSKYREANGMQYVIKNDMGIFNLFASSYSQLIALNSTGEETILYDVNSAQLVKTLTECIIVIVFILTAVIVIVRQFKLNRKI